MLIDSSPFARKVSLVSKGNLSKRVATCREISIDEDISLRKRNALRRPKRETFS